MTPAERLRRIVENAKGDDLERAERAFRNFSPSQMRGQWGESGKTPYEILDEYRQERAEWQRARDLLKRLLGPVR